MDIYEKIILFGIFLGLMLISYRLSEIVDILYKKEN